ncbi:DUF1330 domain-containing protein [Litoricolaceae bacterium]|nr:DUF1330 domain-containing protein [Litorivicinaceae bacterium]
MQKGYWVSCYREIYDADKLAAYAALAKPAVEGQGGQFLVRGTAAYASGSGFKERTVIVEWPTLDAAQAAYESEAYQAALDALSDGVDRDFRIIEGA